MTYRPVYLDTSALAKLVFPERESEALGKWLHAWPDRVTSVLTRVELQRLLRRGRASKSMWTRTDSVLSAVTLLKADDHALHLAGDLRDRFLRTLDAVQLASALSIGEAPEAFVTYDIRLAQAARRARLNVIAPA